MPDQRYDAARQTLGALLSTTSPRIEVPEWQRSYSWDAPQIETFWQDLIAFSDQYPGDNIIGEEYFLGSIVLVIGGPTNHLLDGQQRLATGTILLAGGPPCQAFSQMRNHDRLLGDPRNRLYREFVSILDEFRPARCCSKMYLGWTSSKVARSAGRSRRISRSAASTT